MKQKLLALMFGVICTFQSVAKADVEFGGPQICNYTGRDEVHCVLGFFDRDAKVTATKGWYGIKNGECRRFWPSYGAYCIAGSSYWPGSTSQDTMRRCLARSKAFHFFSAADDNSCYKQGGEMATFRYLGNGDWKWNLNP